MAQQKLIGIGVIGPRISDIPQVSNWELLKSICIELDEKYGVDTYYLVSMSLSSGFGKDTLIWCADNRMRLVQVECGIIGRGFEDGVRVPFGSRDDLKAIFMARHASVMELCTEVYFKVIDIPTYIDDLISRVKASTKPYKILNEYNECLELRSDPIVHHAKKEKA